MLKEFNGVFEKAVLRDGEILTVGSIIWDISKIVEWHKTWTVPEKRKLFCFGSSVLGNCFGYMLINGKPHDKEIWQGDHETEYPNEAINWCASNLKDFICSQLFIKRWS